MKCIALAAIALVALAASASAQVIPPGTNPVPVGGAYNSSPPTCVSGSGCWFQVDVNGNLKVAISGTPSGTQDVNIKQIQGAVPSLTNPLWVFPATGATFPVSGTVTGAAGLGITPTDRTITSASGSSQQMMAANVSRHSLTIVNIGSSNCGINPTGGTAAIGGAGTITLVPTGAYTPRVPTLSAVTVICTSTQPIYGDEN